MTLLPEMFSDVEYLAEEVRRHESNMKAMRERHEAAIRAMDQEISAAMQAFEIEVAARRVYLGAPDVFELIVLQCSDTEKDDQGHMVGRGGMNALRLVSKRCKQVVESVASRLTDHGDDYAQSLPVTTLTRSKRIEHIRFREGCYLNGSPKNLKSLVVESGESIESLEPLSVCNLLETLEINDAGHIVSIAPLSHCTRLRNLTMSGLTITDLTPLSHCTRLRNLTIPGSSITDLTPLSNMLLLEDLDTSNCQVKNISPISRCMKLKKFDISGNAEIKNLSHLRHCPDLEVLCITNLTHIKDLSFVEKGFDKLRLLDISHLPVDDLSPLMRLQNLEDLNCYGIPPTTSFLPLATCCKLKKLTCSRYFFIYPPDANNLDKLKGQRPDLEIISR